MLSLPLLLVASLHWTNGFQVFVEQLIRANNMAGARSATLVKHRLFGDVISHSGLITVDPDMHSNLFFWFFPSTKRDAPLIMWLAGGPGASGLYSLFLENGYFEIVDAETLQPRQHALTSRFSVLYIDNPIGVGFSISSEGYFTVDLQEIASNLLVALRKFYRIFPEIVDRRLFIAGHSYGCKYAVRLAKLIHHSKGIIQPDIRLDGIIISNGLCDPRNQFEYHNLWEHVGLVDRKQMRKVSTFEKEIRKLITNDDPVGAYNLLDQLVTGHHIEDGGRSLFETYTNGSFFSNFIGENSAWEKEFDLYEILHDVGIQEAIHVGIDQDQVMYHGYNLLVEKELIGDITGSVAHELDELLQHYRVLHYSGQLDLLVPYTGTKRFLNNLRANGTVALQQARRGRILYENKLIGYVQKSGKLTEVLLRSAGHFTYMDQPKNTLITIVTFVADRF